MKKFEHQKPISQLFNAVKCTNDNNLVTTLMRNSDAQKCTRLCLGIRNHCAFCPANQRPKSTIKKKAHKPLRIS